MPNSPTTPAANGAPEDLHPLENTWTLWFDSNTRNFQGGRPKSPKPWEERLNMVQVVESVEEFWSMMSVVKKPTALAPGSTYHFFKTGVKPMWEDAANQDGGQWIVTLAESSDLYKMDTLWDEVLMAIIGEMLDDEITGNQIMGAVLARRKYNSRIHVWIKDKDATDDVAKIGARLRECLQVKSMVNFVPHGEGEPTIKLPSWEAPAGEGASSETKDEAEKKE